MIKLLAFSLLLGACTLELEVGDDGPSDSRDQVALIPVTVNRNLDLLFVIDDSPAASEQQMALNEAFPALVQALDSMPGGRPELHLGVVSSDMGTFGADDAAPGPGIGSGPGSCTGRGKDGVLQGSADITDNFIVDVDNGNGTRWTNYTTTLADAFRSISSLGGQGCGFEQPLHAAKRSFAQPANVGFRRPAATLGVIVVSNEDDCSLSHSTMLGSDTATFGPLQSFRCTRFGVTCDQGGATSDDMNKVGAKSNCHATASSPYLTDVAATASYLRSLNPDARNVLFGAIAGNGSSLEVEMRQPPGGGSAIPALKHACTWQQMPDQAELAVDPSIRLTDAAHAFERSFLGQACNNMTGNMLGLARELRSMMSDPCLTRDIATPIDCEAWDVTPQFQRAIPLCTSTQTTGDCYQLINDPIACMGQGLRVQITRVLPPSPDTMVSVRCKL
jgi:hypothetical protein